jgi:zinc transport system substrate-binding protein
MPNGNSHMLRRPDRTANRRPISVLIGLAFVVAILATLPIAMPTFAGDPPRVVVAIRPLHGLVAGVMAGIAEPELLVAGAQSPHHFALSPSGARQLERADLVFIAGGGLMPAIDDAIATLARRAKIIDLSRAEGIQLLLLRDFTHADATHRDDSGKHGHGSQTGLVDPHYWLDPMNAKAMVSAASSALVEADPGHATRYGVAAHDMVEKLEHLMQEIEAQLSPYHARRFIVFHDAYQYFEKRFGLAALGTIAPAPEARPGAAHLRATRQHVTAGNKICMFGEPGAPPALLAAMARNGNTRTAQLDPLGREVPAGPGQYFAMMRAIAATVTDCFSQL